MTRVVPGDVWLADGGAYQAREWAALRTDFWDEVDLRVYEIARVRQWRTADEERREVILHMEADVLGTMVPGSLRIGPWKPFGTVDT
jgi:hypothetical protein